MAEECERSASVAVEIGPVPGRFRFGLAAGRVYRAPRPLRFVGEPPSAGGGEFDYVVVDCFPVEIDALRVYFTEDGLFPDLVQAFNPPLVLTEGDVLEPTIPADAPAACRRTPES